MLVEHLAHRVFRTLEETSKSLPNLLREITGPESMFLRHEDERCIIVPRRQAVICGRFAALKWNVFDERYGLGQHFLSSLFIRLDPINNGSMSGVRAHEEDVCGLVELDIVIPEIC